MKLVLERSGVFATCHHPWDSAPTPVLVPPLITSPATNYKPLNCGSRRKPWRDLGSVCFALKLPSSWRAGVGPELPPAIPCASIPHSRWLCQNPGAGMSSLAHLCCLDITFWWIMTHQCLQIICLRYQLALMRWESVSSASFVLPGWQQKEWWLLADLRGNEGSQSTQRTP